MLPCEDMPANHGLHSRSIQYHEHSLLGMLKQGQRSATAKDPNHSLDSCQHKYREVGIVKKRMSA